MNEPLASRMTTINCDYPGFAGFTLIHFEVMACLAGLHYNTADDTMTDDQLVELFVGTAEFGGGAARCNHILVIVEEAEQERAEEAEAESA